MDKREFNKYAILEIANELSDERSDWLELRRKETSESGEEFYFEIEMHVWYIVKLAELQYLIMQENKNK